MGKGRKNTPQRTPGAGGACIIVAQHHDEMATLAPLCLPCSLRIIISSSIAKVFPTKHSWWVFSMAGFSLGSPV